jgi:hypothetical protein
VHPASQPHFPDHAADDGKATRALQSSLADAKVEVEFWKRKVRSFTLQSLFADSLTG